MQRKRISLFQSSLVYRDKRFSGYDAATVIEVIEHLDENRLQAFEKVLFEFTRPQTVIVSTPNKEYNFHYQNLFEGNLRHRTTVLSGPVKSLKRGQLRLLRNMDIV